jgi:hypothetical protein
MKKYLFVALIGIAGVAYADHMRPPQAAFDACAKSKQGDTCSFTKANHSVNGTCQVPRHHATGSDGSAAPAATLVCHAPHHDHGGGSGSGS